MLFSRGAHERPTIAESPCSSAMLPVAAGAFVVAVAWLNPFSPGPSFAAVSCLLGIICTGVLGLWMRHIDAAAVARSGLLLAALIVMGSPGPSTVSLTAVAASLGLRASLNYGAGLVLGTVALSLATFMNVLSGLAGGFLAAQGYWPFAIVLGMVFVFRAAGLEDPHAHRHHTAMPRRQALALVVAQRMHLGGKDFKAQRGVHWLLQPVVDQRLQDMLGRELLVVAVERILLGGLDEAARPLGIFLDIHLSLR